MKKIILFTFLMASLQLIAANVSRVLVNGVATDLLNSKNQVVYPGKGTVLTAYSISVVIEENTKVVNSTDTDAAKSVFYLLSANEAKGAKGKLTNVKAKDSTGKTISLADIDFVIE